MLSSHDCCCYWISRIPQTPSCLSNEQGELTPTSLERSKIDFSLGIIFLLLFLAGVVFNVFTFRDALSFYESESNLRPSGAIGRAGRLLDVAARLIYDGMGVPRSSTGLRLSSSPV